MLAIEFQDVSKSFIRHSGRVLLRKHLTNLLGARKKERFYALKQVSFKLEKGESLAIIGPNGAGKSTLLSMVTGLCPADSGNIRVNGRVAALLQLGAGFHTDLTGSENLRLNAALMGLGARRTAELYDEIVEFAGIGDFIEEPLRTYSSGMMLRLAFAIAVNVDPDILITDEVLAVGDQSFQVKCLERILRFKQEGKTILSVSHDLRTSLDLCQRAIWLEQGQIRMEGKAADVIREYRGSQAVPA